MDRLVIDLPCARCLGEDLEYQPVGMDAGFEPFALELQLASAAPSGRPAPFQPSADGFPVRWLRPGRRGGTFRFWPGVGVWVQDVQQMTDVKAVEFAARLSDGSGHQDIGGPLRPWCPVPALLDHDAERTLAAIRVITHHRTARVPGVVTEQLVAGELNCLDFVAGAAPVAHRDRGDRAVQAQVVRIRPVRVTPMQARPRPIGLEQQVNR